MDDRLEGLVHVLDLPDLVVRPLPMKAQHGDAPAVHRVGVDLAVAVVVRDLLAASGEPDYRAIVATVHVLEVLPVAPAARIALDPAHEPGRRLLAPAPHLDVVAAREVELCVVEPPRHVEVHPTHAVLVVRHAIGEAGGETPPIPARGGGGGPSPPTPPGGEARPGERRIWGFKDGRPPPRARGQDRHP